MSIEQDLIRIEPEDRLVILASTLQAHDPDAATIMAGDFGTQCIGRALYRHRAIVEGASNTVAWSHVELVYFRDVAPIAAALTRQPDDARLLRAELLLTTPGAFVLPRGWQGTTAQASIEYIHVGAAHLAAYREIMRLYAGPAAAKLVESGRFGTFRAMETAAILFQDPSFDVEWNQIHLCEMEATGFQGFGPEFDAALREIAPDADFAKVFAGLGAMRTVPRWTFNDAVIEADFALSRAGPAVPSPR